MERATIVHCCGCQRPIIRGEDFVCFKVPVQKPTNSFIADSEAEIAGTGILVMPF
jgi:hypothetical protein